MEFTQGDIEMFGKARDLQAEWKPRVGDWFHKADGLGLGSWLICTIRGQTLWCAGTRMSSPVFNNRLVEFRAPEHYTWMPSLEQLQEMVMELNYTLAHQGGSALWELVFDHLTLASDNLKILLLGFVMRERYHRKWNGKTWKKQWTRKAK